MTVRISSMSGNEIFCLVQKGLTPGEIVVGNSVVSIGLAGGIGAMGRQLAGGEIKQVTELISEGRHKAIERMEQEAQRDGASGVTGVETKLGQLAGFTEFLSQGTGVHAQQQGGRFFSTAASGIGLYCQLDAGYQPIRFSMGNIAYALGVGRGVMGQLRTLARGEVKEFSSMYNQIRHTALNRLKAEAAQQGANAVVDIQVRMLPAGPGTVELLLTGTASHHPALSNGPVQPEQVVTSELTGEELWNLASIGYAPLQLVMTTSVVSLGVAAGVGAMFRSVKRGELPEVTRLVYEARENALELVRKEAQQLGAEQVMSTRLQINEIGQGLIELVAIGTAVRRAPETMRPASPALIPQALILDKNSSDIEDSVKTLAPAAPMALAQQGAQGIGSRAIGCFIALFMFVVMGCGGIFAAIGNM